MGSGEAPASQLPGAVGTRELRGPKIGLRLVLYQDHGRLLLASAHPARLVLQRVRGEWCCILGPGPAECKPSGGQARKRPNARNCAHHAGDAMDSSCNGSRPSRPSSPTVTPLGVHVVIQSVALQLVRTMTSAIALVMAVPLTTALAVAVATADRRSPR